jgi:hypothetical protein
MKRCTFFGLVLLFFTLKFASKLDCQSNCKNICHKYNQKGSDLDYILCNKFDDLHELNHNICKSFPSISNYELRPNSKLILTNDWNIAHLNELIFGQNLENSDMINNIKLKNFLGIDVELFKGQNLMSGSESIIRFILQNSNFDFYYKNKFIEECNANTASLIQYPFIFGEIKRLQLAQNVRFTRPICPYMFKNAEITYFEINCQIDHFLKKNLLKFSKISDRKTKIIELNTLIDNFYIDGYAFKIDSIFLNRLVFESIVNLFFKGTIKSIEHDVFKSFNYLRILRFDMVSLRNFYHQVGLEWLSYLNMDLNASLPFEKNLIRYRVKMVNLVQIKLDSGLFYGLNYSYPDEDACVFHNFPHLRLIFPILNPINYTSECSCTLLMLVRYIPQYKESLVAVEMQQSYEIMSSIYESCIRIISSSNSSKDCLDLSNISSNNIMCKNFSNKTKFKEDFTPLDLILDLRTVHFFVSIILTPLACVVGFLLNIFVFRNINSRKKDLKEKFYQYTKVNSIINSMYCLIYMTNLMSECIMRDSIYCSSIYSEFYAQYLKIYAVSYLCNAIKICSNVTLILITVNRFILIGKNHYKLCKLLSEIPIQRVVFAILPLSLIISLLKVYQFEVNEDLEDYEYPLIRVGGESEAKIGKIITVLILIHDFFNYVLFLLINTFLECVILFKLHKELKEKKKKFLVVSKSVSLLIQQIMTKEIRRRQFKIKRNLSSIYRKEMRAFLMVILNGVMNFILRMPETSLLIYFVLYYYYPSNKFYQEMCQSFLICVTLVDISNLFYVLSFSGNFFMFYFFNFKLKRNFKWF